MAPKLLVKYIPNLKEYNKDWNLRIAEEYQLKQQTTCVVKKHPEVYLWNKGPDEESLVSSYLSLLEDEDINQLAQIYRWEVEYVGKWWTIQHFQEWFRVVWIFPNEDRIS